MKILQLLLFLILIVISDKSNVEGKYHDSFGSYIELNENHTYYYSWHLCMDQSWIKGAWKLNMDTIILQPILIYDTVYYYDSLLGVNSDSLTLSLDTIPNSFFQSNDKSVNILSGGQNLYGSPRKFYYKKGKLFNIDKKGRVQNKKRKGFIDGRKKYPPYYIRINN